MFRYTVVAVDIITDSVDENNLGEQQQSLKLLTQIFDNNEK